MKNYFERIEFIYNILTTLHIPCTINALWEGWQLRFPWCEGDVAAHRGTYGEAAGNVESYCFPWDEGDVTVLTPEEAAIKIIALYNSAKRKINMKVFMYESTIINLSEVKYIDAFLVNKIRASIRFHMKGENNEIVLLENILSTKVPEILEECYKIMKKED